MTDIVERLRTLPSDNWSSFLLEEAADQIERLQGDNTEHRLRETAMRQEVERLEHMKANLHGHIKRLEDENSELRRESAIHASNTLAAIDDYNDALAENAKLREALAGLVEVAGGGPGFFDKIAIARAALQKDEGE